MSNTNEEAVLNEVSFKQKVVSWVKTTRIQTAMVTSLALWLGFITVESHTYMSIILLAGVGTAIHIWGFTLNEVEDYKYDASQGNVKGHPIAKGKVHKEVARYVAWLAAIVAILGSVLSPYKVEATVLLILSLIPGYLYDKYSKVHWWSNLYLSAWAFMMVIAGAMYAGMPNMTTFAIASAISIQIFVQVIQGDLKDLKGSEKSFCKKLGVQVNTLAKFKSGVDDRFEVVSYPPKFSIIVYGLKILELILLGWVVLNNPLNTSMSYYAVILGLTVGFVATLGMLLVYVYDRGRIKKMSSLHELVSIALLGAVVFGIDPRGAILIGALPIIWYIAVNYVIHSGSLNPDI